jgi:hypothetical protein
VVRLCGPFVAGEPVRVRGTDGRLAAGAAGALPPAPWAEVSGAPGAAAGERVAGRWDATADAGDSVKAGCEAAAGAWDWGEDCATARDPVPFDGEPPDGPDGREDLTVKPRERLELCAVGGGAMRAAAGVAIRATRAATLATGAATLAAWDTVLATGATALVTGAVAALMTGVAAFATGAVAALTTGATEVATGAVDAMGRDPPRPVDDAGTEAAGALTTDAAALATGAADLPSGAIEVATGAARAGDRGAPLPVDVEGVGAAGALAAAGASVEATDAAAGDGPAAAGGLAAGVVPSAPVPDAPVPGSANAPAGNASPSAASIASANSDRRHTAPPVVAGSPLRKTLTNPGLPLARANETSQIRIRPEKSGETVFPGSRRRPDRTGGAARGPRSPRPRRSRHIFVTTRVARRGAVSESME